MDLDGRQLENLIPMIAMIFGIVGVALPAIVFSQARRIIRDHEHLAGLMVGVGAVITIIGLMIGGTVVLALIGWLPSPTELMSLTE